MGCCECGEWTCKCERNRLRRIKAGEALGKGLTITDTYGIKHDMLNGPCCCGGHHKVIEELV